MGLLSCSHGRLQQILDRDLVPQSLVEQPLPGRQLTVGQDLDLQRERRATVLKISQPLQSHIYTNTHTVLPN